MRRSITTIPLVIITILAGLFLAGIGNDDKESLRQTFQVDATYYESGQIEVTYLDRSMQTNFVVLEILGMEESYQKVFSESEFKEIVPFPNKPKYGWATHPVVLNIDHQKFGTIQIKTEIHQLGEPAPNIIYGRP